MRLAIPVAAALSAFIAVTLPAQSNDVGARPDTTTARDSARAVAQPAAPETWRSRAEARGVVVSLALTNDVSNVVHGGVARGSATRGLFNGIVEGDLEKMMGWKGGSFLVGWAAQRGENGSTLAGDAQAFSNVDAQRFNHLYETWVQQTLFSERIRLKVGRVDANTEFASVEPAAGFINASAGFSPTITGLPTYPDPQLSANLFVRPLSWLEFGAGYFKGTFEDVDQPGGVVKDKFFIAQAVVSWKGGHAHVGRWAHSGIAVGFDGEFTHKPSDWYVAMDQRLSGHDEVDEEHPATGLRMFAKYGAAPNQVATFKQHMMLGVVRDGGFRSGSTHQAGVAVTHVDLSDHPAAGFQGDETSFEGYYRLPILGQLALRPDVQYIVHPSGSHSVRNALVATLRFDVAY